MVSTVNTELKIPDHGCSIVISALSAASKGKEGNLFKLALN